MNPRTDDLIITDTSPLITLAIADHLHVLTMSRIRIVIPDAVFVEATRIEGAPGASRLIEWAANHDDLVSIRPTEVGLDQINRLKTGRTIRGLGEAAALEVLETTARHHPTRHLFLLFEDRDIEKRSIILPPNAYAIATGDWLRILETAGLIQSADQILDRAATEGRTMERQRMQLSRPTAIDAASAAVAKTSRGRER
jgi:hypothetical protein